MAPTLPIVYLPGIGGTRLGDPVSGRKVWDPLPSGSLPAWNVSRLMNAAPLTPWPTVDNLPRMYGRLTAREEAVARAIPGYGGVVFDAGGRLLVRLADDAGFRSALAGLGLRPAVYVAGYDWRRSNEASAARLGRIVEIALRTTNTRRVVLVCHSMGGLVARWFCRFGSVGGVPASRVVAGVFLLGSPTYGAPVMFRFLKLKFAALREAQAESDMFIGALGGGGRDLARSMPAAYELLPNEVYCAARPTWLRFDTARAGISNAANPVSLYANTFAGLLDDPSTRTAVSGMLAARTRFHRRLGAYVPANTTIVYSTDLPTDGGYTLVHRSWWQPGWEFSLDPLTPADRGDATVPVLSASVNPMMLRPPIGLVPGIAARRVPVARRIAHRDLPDHPVVADVVMRGIISLIAGTPAPEFAPHLAAREAQLALV